MVTQLLPGVATSWLNSRTQSSFGRKSKHVHDILVPPQSSRVFSSGIVRAVDGSDDGSGDRGQARSKRPRGFMKKYQPDASNVP